MAKDSSFDIVSDYDVSEMANAVDQAQRELAIRYDFKGTSADLEWADGKNGLLIKGDSQVQLDAVLDVLQGKLIKRGVPLSAIDSSKEPVQGGKEMRWELTFKKGLDQEKAKKITKVIRDNYPKVKASIQGDEVRCSAASRDDLQGVIALLNKQEFDFPLSFTNYR